MAGEEKRAELKQAIAELERVVASHRAVCVCPPECGHVRTVPCECCGEGEYAVMLARREGELQAELERVTKQIDRQALFNREDREAIAQERDDFESRTESAESSLAQALDALKRIATATHAPAKHLQDVARQAIAEIEAGEEKR